jgi:hypothetical protein
MTQLMGPMYTPSDEATRLAYKYNLGQPIYEYKETVASYGCGTVAFLTIGVFSLIASINKLFAATNNSSSISNGNFAVTAFAIGFGGLVLGLILLGVAISKSGNRLFAYNDGFVYKQGGEEIVVAWNNVRAIFQRIVEHRGRLGKYTTYTYTIEEFDGSRLTFNDNITPMEGLCNYVETSMSRRLFPRAILAYNMGQIVDFGTLAVSKQGVFNGKEWLSWNEVDGISFKNGYISVKKRGKWLNWGSFFTPTIPNFTVLELLIQHIEQTRGWSRGW